VRKNLKQLEEVRTSFTGVFVRFGTKSGWKGLVDTVLLKAIKNDQGRLMTDHLWFNKTKGFEKVELQEGDVVRFDARVKEYEKGYKGYREDVCKSIEIDYKLSHPTRIEKIKV
jgi:hypothetical protein